MTKTPISSDTTDAPKKKRGRPPGPSMKKLEAAEVSQSRVDPLAAVAALENIDLNALDVLSSDIAAPNPTTPVGTDLEKGLLKDQISAFYQVQKVRIQLGNKLAAHFYRKLGIDAAETLIKQHQGDRKTSLEFMDVLKLEYKRVADALSTDSVVKERAFVKLTDGQKGVFSAYTELSFMQQYRQVLTSEVQILKDIESNLNNFPIWTTFLKNIKGMGPTIGGVIVSVIDIHKAETPASLHKYAGLDVVITNADGEPDGRGRGRFKDHLVPMSYIDSKGVEQVRDSITFNPLLKTKLVGVWADIMVKHRTPKYREEYDNYKHRITQREELNAQQDPDYKKRTPAHLNRMALRYAVKRLLVDIYLKWRALEGLPITEEYGVRKLGLVHHTGAGPKTSQAFIPPADNSYPQEPEETPAPF